MENKYSQQEQVSLKSFSVFSFLLLIILNIGFIINSSFFRVDQIEINNKSKLFQSIDFSNIVLNQSIWLIDSDTFTSIKMNYPTVDRISVIKEYPNKIILNIIEYEELIVITDLRNSIPLRTVLFKNMSEVKSDQKFELATLTISNGPVPPGFNGELVSMLMTLKNYNLSNTSFSFIYNGNNFTGTYKNAFINFGPPIDLGIKAAALGSLLENADCSGDIRFITSEDIIADC